MRRREALAAAVVLGLGLAAFLRLRAGGDVVPATLPAAEATRAEAPPQAVLLATEKAPARAVGVAPQGPGAPRVADEAPRTTRPPDLEGVVLDPAGAPAVGIEVSARCVAADGSFFGTKVTTGADGRFALALHPAFKTADIACGVLEGQATPPPSTMGVEIAGVTFPRRDLVLRLAEGAWVRGVVLDEAGDPVPAVSIAAAGHAEAVAWRPSVATTTDAQGRFAIGPLRPGRWTLVVLPAGDRTWTEVPAVAPAEGVTVRLVRGFSLRARLLGPDAAGFEVQWFLPPGPEGARAGTVKADDAGDFVIERMPASPVRLFARRIGDDRCALVEGARPGPQRLEVPLVAGQAIEGPSEGYDGRVIAHQGDLQHEGRAEGGRFRIAGLPPGRWTLRRVQRMEGKRGSSVFAVEFELQRGTDTTAEAGSTGVEVR